METPNIGQYEKDLIKDLDNDNRKLLICPHCGELLEEIIIAKLVRIVDSYILNSPGIIEYNDCIDESIYDDAEYEYYCAHCDAELDYDQVNELIDRDILNL